MRAQDSPPSQPGGAPGSGGQGPGAGLLAPRPRKDVEIMKPEEGERMVLEVIKNFIKQYPPYRVYRVWQFDKYSTTDFVLKSTIDLRVSSYFRDLIVLDKNGELMRIETIWLVATRGDKVIDSMRIHIDLSLVEGMSIDNVWFTLMGPDTELGRSFCLENEIKFDVRQWDENEINNSQPAGIEVYSIEACNIARHVLSRGGLKDEEEEE